MRCVTCMARANKDVKCALLGRALSHLTSTYIAYAHTWHTEDTGEEHICLRAIPFKIVKEKRIKNI